MAESDFLMKALYTGEPIWVCKIPEIGKKIKVKKATTVRSLNIALAR